jgi:integrase
VALSSVDRMRASNAADRLKPFGKTLDDAVNFYSEHLKRQFSSVPFSEFALQVRTEFIRRLAENEASVRHAESFENALRKLEGRFASRLVSEISVKDIRDWLTGMPLAAKARNKVRGYARQIFGLAVDYGHATVNPVIGTKKFRERSSEENGEISILSAEETARVFAAADPEILPFSRVVVLCRDTASDARTARLERHQDGRETRHRSPLRGQKRQTVSRYCPTI